MGDDWDDLNNSDGMSIQLFDSLWENGYSTPYFDPRSQIYFARDIYTRTEIKKSSSKTLRGLRRKMASYLSPDAIKK